MTNRYVLAIVLSVSATFVAAQPVVGGVRTNVAVRAGSQFDPHISGTVISYTDADGSGLSSGIRYYDLAVPGGNDSAAGEGTFAELSDIDAGRIAYTRTTVAEGVTTRSIHVFDIATRTDRMIDFQPGSDRRDVAIGGDTVAWIEYSGSVPAIGVYDLSSGGPPIDIVVSGGVAGDLAVSPDGSRVAYTHCAAGLSLCDIALYDVPRAWMSVYGSDDTEDRNPDLSNDRLVYQETDSAGDTDVVWAALTAGATSGRVDLPGDQLNPSLSGDFVAFEGLSADNGSFDIYAFDVAANELYRLTDAAADEILNDVAVGADGLIRATWSVNVGPGDDDILAVTFTRRPPPCAPQTAAEACADPAGRPLLAHLTLTRGQGLPLAAATFRAADGDAGVACIANARATWGIVTANLQWLAGPADFGRDVTLIARSVRLRSLNSVAAAIGGEAGGSFDVKVYGKREGCAE